MDRQAEGKADGKTDRQADRQINRLTDRQMDKRWMNIKTGGKKNIKKHKLTYGQKDG